MAAWQTPPPIDGTSTPFSIAWPSRNPRSAVRLPTVALKENVAPGFTIAPSSSFASRATLKTRLAEEEPRLVVASLTTEVAPSARAAAVVNSGCVTRNASAAVRRVPSCPPARVRCSAVVRASRSMPLSDESTRARFPSTCQRALRAGRR